MKKLLHVVFLFGCCLLFGNCSKKNATPVVDVSGGDTRTVSTESVGAAGIAGLNWADGRDNFVDGWVIPSGLTASDSYSTVAAKTDAILNGFSSQVSGVNTIRIPINPPSVAESWWGSYTAAIDKATAKGWKVIIGCWEGASSKDGIIDNTTNFW